MVTVLTYHGKRESIDTVKIDLFDTVEEAAGYIEEFDNPDDKYYTHCEIVKLGVTYEIHGNDCWGPANLTEED